MHHLYIFLLRLFNLFTTLLQIFFLCFFAHLLFVLLVILRQSSLVQLMKYFLSYPLIFRNLFSFRKPLPSSVHSAGISIHFFPPSVVFHYTDLTDSIILIILFFQFPEAIVPLPSFCKNFHSSFSSVVFPYTDP